MGDPGYDGVPFCKAGKRENSRVRTAGAFASNPQANGRPEVAGTYVNCDACGVGFTEDGKGGWTIGLREGVGKVGSGGSVRLC